MQTFPTREAGRRCVTDLRGAPGSSAGWVMTPACAQRWLARRLPAPNRFAISDVVPDGMSLRLLSELAAPQPEEVSVACAPCATVPSKSRAHSRSVEATCFFEGQRRAIVFPARRSTLQAATLAAATIKRLVFDRDSSGYAGRAGTQNESARVAPCNTMQSATAPTREEGVKDSIRRRRLIGRADPISSAFDTGWCGRFPGPAPPSSRCGPILRARGQSTGARFPRAP